MYQLDGPQTSSTAFLMSDKTAVGSLILVDEESRMSLWTRYLENGLQEEYSLFAAINYFHWTLLDIQEIFGKEIRFGRDMHSFECLVETITQENCHIVKVAIIGGKLERRRSSYNNVADVYHFHVAIKLAPQSYTAIVQCGLAKSKLVIQLGQTETWCSNNLSHTRTAGSHATVIAGPITVIALSAGRSVWGWEPRFGRVTLWQRSIVMVTFSDQVLDLGSRTLDSSTLLPVIQGVLNLFHKLTSHSSSWRRVKQPFLHSSSRSTAVKQLKEISLLTGWCFNSPRQPVNWWFKSPLYPSPNTVASFKTAYGQQRYGNRLKCHWSILVRSALVVVVPAHHQLESAAAAGGWPSYRQLSAVCFYSRRVAVISSTLGCVLVSLYTLVPEPTISWQSAAAAGGWPSYRQLSAYLSPPSVGICSCSRRVAVISSTLGCVLVNLSRLVPEPTISWQSAAAAGGWPSYRQLSAVCFCSRRVAVISSTLGCVLVNLSRLVPEPTISWNLQLQPAGGRHIVNSRLLVPEPTISWNLQLQPAGGRHIVNSRLCACDCSRRVAVISSTLGCVLVNLSRLVPEPTISWNLQLQPADGRHIVNSRLCACDYSRRMAVISSTLGCVLVSLSRLVPEPTISWQSAAAAGGRPPCINSDISIRLINYVRMGRAGPANGTLCTPPFLRPDSTPRYLPDIAVRPTRPIRLWIIDASTVDGRTSVLHPDQLTVPLYCVDEQCPIPKEAIVCAMAEQNEHWSVAVELTLIQNAA
ncbi:hypothetical protein J6590_075343 [Homalodisca vitripennis]|nr:hypothetical protein J6590_075343 [Homalodisca vitripennis]